MPATTLYKMALQAAIRLSAQINDIADMPYELARPFLLKIQSPQQLRDIEINCPHIAEADEELWRAFIARDIPDWESKIAEPKNKRSWHKIYLMLQRREERKAAEDEEKLRKTLAGEGLKKAEKEALFVQKVLPHARAEDEHNFFVDGVPNKKLNGWGGEKKQPSLKNAKTGKEMLGAIRRQAADASKARAMVRTVVPQTAAQKLANAKRQITQPPAGMTPTRSLTIAPRELHPHEKDMMADIKRARATQKIQPPTRTTNAKLAEKNQQTVEAAARKARAENEAKLKALTQNHKKPPPAASPPKRFEFAPSAVVVDPAKRLSPPTVPASMNTDGRTSFARQPAAVADVPTSPKQLVASTERSPGVCVTPPESTSPNPSSPPPKMIKKRPAPGSIFMNNKKRKI